MADNEENIEITLSGVTMNLEQENNVSLDRKKTSESTIRKQDEKTIELLDLLDKYQEIVLENSSSYMEAFIGLTKANCLGGPFSKKFGMDAYDFRPHDANKKIDCSEFFSLIETKEAEKDSPNELSQLELESTTEKYNSEIEFRNRKRKHTRTERELLKQNTEIEKDDMDKLPIKDPILQFGIFVPKQLKEAQVLFNKSLIQSIQIANLKKRIETTVQEIERLAEN